MLIRLMIILFCFSGCNKPYDEAACNELSMKRFRGFVDAPNKFKKNCMDFKITYTSELCQSAFNDLILSRDMTQVKAKYGNPIEQCFNEDDIRKFSNNTKP